MTHKLALIGFGAVGQGLAQILRDKGDALRQNLGFEAKIVAVATRSKGSLYHPEGLDLIKLLEAVKNGSLVDYPNSPRLERGWDKGATNAITYECDLLGPITLVGAGAGGVETGFALLIDLISLVRRNL